MPAGPKGPLLVLEHSRVLGDRCGRVGQPRSKVTWVTDIIPITYHAFSVGIRVGTLKGHTILSVTPTDLSVTEQHISELWVQFQTVSAYLHFI